MPAAATAAAIAAPPAMRSRGFPVTQRPVPPRTLEVGQQAADLLDAHPLLLGRPSEKLQRPPCLAVHALPAEDRHRFLCQCLYVRRPPQGGLALGMPA